MDNVNYIREYNHNNKLNMLILEFLETPNEEHFRKLLEVGQHSQSICGKVLYHYNELSKLMLPISDESVNLLATRAALKQLSASIGLCLEIVLSHENPWRRWTAAKTIGEFGNCSALGVLEKRLEVEEVEYVRNYLKEAIENLNMTDCSSL